MLESSRPWACAAAVAGHLGFGAVLVGKPNVKEHCGENIARHKVPECVDFVEEHPMAASGKIQKFKLPEAAVEQHFRPPAARRGGYEVSLRAGGHL